LSRSNVSFIEVFRFPGLGDIDRGGFRFTLIFTGSRLDLTGSAHSGVDAELRQDHQLQKQPEYDQTQHPENSIHN
jgi:hypothetical protein